MQQGKRGTYIWLGIMGVVVVGVALSGAIGAVGGLLAIGGYAALLAAIFASDRLGQLQNVIPTLTVSARMTPAARDAVSRARRLSSYTTDETVTDVGIIVNERDRNNRLNRRITASVSLDEAAIQPYIKINVPPAYSQRVALVSFEVLDKTGKVQFTRQVEQYVRDGENLIACDQQLPMRGNDKLGRTGTWDLRVSVNGTLAAVHSFGVTPSVAVQRSRLADDGEARAAAISVPDEKDDDMPLSLEDLLREQRGGTSSRGS